MKINPCTSPQAFSFLGSFQEKVTLYATTTIIFLSEMKNEKNLCAVL